MRERALALENGRPRLHMADLQQWPPPSYGRAHGCARIIPPMLTALFHPANFMTRLLGREDRPQPAPAGIRRLLAVGVKAGRLQELPMGKGRMVVHCRSGEVWITHDGDPRDVVLRQDESYIVD